MRELPGGAKEAGPLSLGVISPDFSVVTVATGGAVFPLVEGVVAVPAAIVVTVVVVPGHLVVVVVDADEVDVVEATVDGVLEVVFGFAGAIFSGSRVDA